MVAEFMYEIVVAPKDGSTGANLVMILNALDIAARTGLVVVADVECNGNRSWVQRSPLRTTLEKLVEYAKGVGQFDWGTLFFFREPSSDPLEAQDYGDLFVSADVVVRAIDDTYFYVYSATTDDASKLGRFFPVEFREKQRNAIVHPF